MKKKAILFALVVLILSLALTPGVATAQKNKDHSLVKKNDILAVTGIDRKKQAIIKDYLLQHAGKKHCPPGLAKKHSGCLPPGIAKKYSIGKKLPKEVVLKDLPKDLLELLGAAPDGHIYAQIDDDVVLVSKATQQIVDAVTLLSALSQ